MATLGLLRYLEACGADIAIMLLGPELTSLLALRRDGADNAIPWKNPLLILGGSGMAQTMRFPGKPP